MKTVLSLLLVLGLSVVLVTAQAASPADLYQEALRVQEVKGDLTKAVELYRAITTRYATDRAVAPKAMLRLAECYEILSRPDAIATYQRVVTTFPDQRDIVAAARTRLAALASAKAQVERRSPRRVNIADGFSVGDVTYDGRLAAGWASPAGIDGAALRGLIVQDVVTSHTTVLFSGSGPMIGNPPVISASGRQVAYVEDKSAPPGQPPFAAALRIVGTEPGAQSKTLLAAETSAVPKAVFAWSRDEKAILVLIAKFEPQSIQPGGFSIAWVSAADGAVKVIKSFEQWRAPQDGAVSFDGGLIAYSAIARAGSTERRVYVMNADGQNETDVVRIAGRNTSPLWTPDGGHLLFVSNRSGVPALWSVPMRGGSAAGEPSLFQKLSAGDRGYVWPIRVSLSGDLYYGQLNLGGDVEFVAERGPTGARVVRTFEGTSGMLSPDGGSMAFIKRSLPGAGTPTGLENAVIVRSLATGEERSYPHAGLANVSPRWLRDGTGFVVLVQAEGGRPASFYLVDLKAGTFRWLFAKDTDTHVRSGVTDLSPDGKTLYMMARQKPATPQSPWTAVVGVDLGTAEERPIVTIPGVGLPAAAGIGLAASPDGTMLALEAWGDAQAPLAADVAKRTARILTVRTDGTAYRELYSAVIQTQTSDVMRWTPDSRALVFATVNRTQAGLSLGRVMRIPVGGGEPEFDGLDFNALAGSVPLPRSWFGPANIDLSANGSYVAFSGLAQPTRELWVIENVMAALNSR